MLLRERSREERVWGNWKSGVVSFEPSRMVLTLFPRRDRWLRFGREVRSRTVEIDSISLLSKVRDVMELGSGHVAPVSWLPDAVRLVSDGNLDATSAIYRYPD